MTEKEDLPYKVVPKISRDYMEYSLPSGLTKKASDLLKEATDSSGHLLRYKETITIKDFSERMLEDSKTKNDEKLRILAENVKRVEPLTLVVFDGNHRDSKKTNSTTLVIGSDLDDAEHTIDSMVEHEVSKFQDEKNRRVSVFVGQGGELKSGVFKSEKLIKKEKSKYKY